MRILFEGVRVSQVGISAPDGVKKKRVIRNDVCVALRIEQARSVRKERLPIDRYLRVALALFLVISAAAPGVWAQESNFETVQTRKASELHSPDMIEGQHYRVDATVTIHGHINVYRIETDFVAFEADDDANLRKLLKDITAIAACIRPKVVIR